MYVTALYPPGWKIWSQSELITEKANYIAIVLTYSPHTQTESGINRTIFTGTIRIGAFNPFLLMFIIGAAVAAWGCYRSTLLAWAGSLFLLAYSILGIFTIGLFILPGAIFLLTGAVLKTIKKKPGEK